MKIPKNPGATTCIIADGCLKNSVKTMSSNGKG